MERSSAVNIAVSVVMASALSKKGKQEVIEALRGLETDALELKQWCQTAKDVLPEDEFNFIQDAYSYQESDE